jgi:hypothetical protein
VTSDARKSGFASKESWNGKDSTIEKDLPEFHVDPIPEQQDFKSAKGSDKRKDGRREEARRRGGYLGPLQRSA